MYTAWLVISVVLLLVALLLLNANRKLRNQRQAMQIQSHEIQKQLRELQQTNQALIELNNEKQQIIGVVSHDLKGPFNRIFALIQLVAMASENLRSDQREYLGKIHQIVVDGLGMVRNLLDNRKLEEKGIDLRPEPLNATAVLASLVKQYQSLAEKKKITIHFETTTVMPVLADRIYMNRIFENLLSNAVKFSPEATNIFVEMEALNGEIEIAIRDEGPGISLFDQAKLYHKFQRLTARPTGGESSTGLGLSIVKTLAEKMGGSVTCESEEGKGAVFKVRLKKNIS